MLSWSTNTFFSQFIILVKHFFSTWLVWTASPMLHCSSSAASFPTRARNSGTTDGCTHTCTRYMNLWTSKYSTALYLPIHYIIYCIYLGLTEKKTDFLPCFSSYCRINPKSSKDPVVGVWHSHLRNPRSSSTGLKPQRPWKRVRAIAISGLWLLSG